MQTLICTRVCIFPAMHASLYLSANTQQMFLEWGECIVKAENKRNLFMQPMLISEI